jgi:hypothetical protein
MSSNSYGPHLICPPPETQLNVQLAMVTTEP